MTDAEAIHQAGQTSGVDLIAVERQRQVEREGWTTEHDAMHAGGELACAAACYALAPIWREHSDFLLHLWPWDGAWWKPTPDDRVRELVKAGALIAAEIDRLQIAATPAAPQPEAMLAERESCARYVEELDRTADELFAVQQMRKRIANAIRARSMSAAPATPQPEDAA